MDPGLLARPAEVRCVAREGADARHLRRGLQWVGVVAPWLYLRAVSWSARKDARTARQDTVAERLRASELRCSCRALSTAAAAAAARCCHFARRGSFCDFAVSRRQHDSMTVASYRARNIACASGGRRYPIPPGFAEWEATVPASFRRDPDLANACLRDLESWLSRPREERCAILRANAMVSKRRRPATACRRGNKLEPGRGLQSKHRRGMRATTTTPSDGARGSTDWYFKARRELGVEVVEHRR